MITNTTVLDRVQAYCEALVANYNRRGYGRSISFSLDNTGQKYNRIVQADADGTARSVHAFVDNDGLVYKSAGWKAPAKDARYDLLNDASYANLLKEAEWAGGALYVGGGTHLPKGYTILDRAPVAEEIVVGPLVFTEHGKAQIAAFLNKRALAKESPEMTAVLGNPVRRTRSKSRKSA